MPFGLKNVGSSYMSSMITFLHYIIHNEIKVYVDDIFFKSKRSLDHLDDLQKFSKSLQKYNLKLNPKKCAFRIPQENYWDSSLTIKV